MNILLMQELARSKQEEIELYGEDWKSKIEQIPVMVKMVKDWQGVLFDKFGQPTVKDEKNHSQWKKLVAGDVIKLKDVAMEKTEFNGATIVQGLEIDTEGKEEAIVKYKALLMTDENHFLRKMLPKTVDIPVHDPAYELFDVTIQVPRGQLVRESLYDLGEMLEREQNMSVPLKVTKKAGRWSLRHWQVLTIITVIGFVAFGVWGLSNYISSLPPAPPAPVSYVNGNTTTIPGGELSTILFENPIVMLLFMAIILAGFIHFYNNRF